MNFLTLLSSSSEMIADTIGLGATIGLFAKVL
jgi:hypothetical protein